MDTASKFFKRKDHDKLSITGNWVLANYKELKKLNNSLSQALSKAKVIDFSELSQMDTNGAHLLINMVGEERLSEVLEQDSSLPSSFRNLLLAVLQDAQKMMMN